MKTTQEILDMLLYRLRIKGFAQVPGYNRFGFISMTDNSVWVTREARQDTLINFEKIRIGIEAVRSDPNVYNLGPSALRSYGITHVNSPVWAILHLATLREILS